ncbi:S66 peptidase family protein [Desulforhopalus sp. 52FAK]
MIMPKPLRKGDTLGIIAPAGMLSDESLFYSGVHVLRELGFEVKFPRELWPGAGYLADCDDNRVDELHTLLCDSDVKAIVCMRGGYGCLRILDKIDLGLIAANPKFLVGFSDITVLLNYLYNKIGLVSLHGPTITTLSNASPDSLEKLQSSLLGEWTRTIHDKNIVQLQGTGTVTAPLIGGNLASLTTLLGTQYDLSWSNSIVFLEDINEPVYKVDRMLTQLAAAGKFEKVKGFILGDFSSQKDADSTGALRYKEQVWQRVLELAPNGHIPVWGNFPAGHCSRNITFPLGAEVTMNCSDCDLTFI